MWKKKQEEVGLDQLDEGDRELFAQMKEKEKKIELWKVCGLLRSSNVNSSLQTSLCLIVIFETYPRL